MQKTLGARFNKTRYLVFIGLFSALAVVLYFIELPVIPGFSYLNYDLSDIPAAVAAVLFGPLAGVAVEFVKNLIHLFAKGIGSTMGYGDLMNFLVGAALVLPLGAVTRLLAKKGAAPALSAVLGGLAGVIGMVAVGVVGNYLIAPPFFLYWLHTPLSGAALWGAIAGATVLNVVKSVVAGILTVPLAAVGKRLLPVERT